MKQNNRETMQRAIGILEGASYGASERVQDAIALATDMLSNVLDDEPSTDIHFLTPAELAALQGN